MRKKQSKRKVKRKVAKIVKRKLPIIKRRKNPIPKAASQSPDELGYFSHNKEPSIKIEGIALESFPDNVILKLFLPSSNSNISINIMLYDNGINLLLSKLMTNSSFYNFNNQSLGFVNIINSEKIVDINVEKIMGGAIIILEMERKKIVPRINPTYTIYLYDNGIKLVKQLFQRFRFPATATQRESKSLVGSIEDNFNLHHPTLRQRPKSTSWDEFK